MNCPLRADRTCSRDCQERKERAKTLFAHQVPACYSADYFGVPTGKIPLPKHWGRKTAAALALWLSMGACLTVQTPAPAPVVLLDKRGNVRDCSHCHCGCDELLHCQCCEGTYRGGTGPKDCAHGATSDGCPDGPDCTTEEMLDLAAERAARKTNGQEVCR